MYSEEITFMILDGKKCEQSRMKEKNSLPQIRFFSSKTFARDYRFHVRPRFLAIRPDKLNELTNFKAIEISAVLCLNYGSNIDTSGVWRSCFFFLMIHFLWSFTS